MKQYIETAKILFKSQMVYRFDVIMTALATVGRIVFAYIVWSVIFNDKEIIGGFTFQSMLSYYVISSFLASLEMSAGISGEVSRRIRDGSFSKYMVIPTSPQLHFMAQNFGACSYYALFSILAAILSAIAFQVKPIITTDFATLMCVALMIPLGLVFMVSYQFFIGILTFKFQDIGLIFHIQGNLISFATGAILPLSLLPSSAIRILRFLPFHYVTYTPTMLLTDQTNVSNGLCGLLILFIWTIFMLLVSQVTYNRLRVKYDGVGI